MFIAARMDRVPLSLAPLMSSPTPPSGATPPPVAEVDLGAALVPLVRELTRQAYRLTRNERDAEDLVQETLLRALRHQSQFSRGSNLRAWVGRILVNTFVNEYRRATRQRALFRNHGEQIWLGHPFSHLTTAAAADPEVAFAAAGLSPETLRALDGLPAPFREVVLLYDLMDFTYPEIATLLAVPPGTVMSRLFRGRRLLRRRLMGHARLAGCISRDCLERAAA